MQHCSILVFLVKKYGSEQGGTHTQEWPNMHVSKKWTKNLLSLLQYVMNWSKDTHLNYDMLTDNSVPEMSPKWVLFTEIQKNNWVLTISHKGPKKYRMVWNGIQSPTLIGSLILSHYLNDGRAMRGGSIKSIVLSKRRRSLYVYRASGMHVPIYRKNKCSMKMLSTRQQSSNNTNQF